MANKIHETFTSAKKLNQWLKDNGYFEKNGRVFLLSEKSIYPNSSLDYGICGKHDRGFYSVTIKTR